MDINIRDYILTEAETKSTKPVKAEYEVIFNSGPDFIVRRKSAKASKLFVCLMSQGQFYFKNEKNAETTRISMDDMIKFFSDIPGSLRINNAWCVAIGKGTANMGRFITVISNPFFVNLAKQGLIKLNFSKSFSTNFDTFSEQTIATGIRVLSGLYSKEEIASAVGSVFTHEYSKGAEYLRKDVKVLFDELGIDDSRKYVQRRAELPQLGTQLPDYTRLFYPEFTWNNKGSVHHIFEHSKFIEYALQECVHQGYAQEEATFISEWVDILSMQKQLFGKVKEKYPENIPAVHQIYSYHVRMRKQKVDEAKFAEQTNRLKAYEWRNSEYVIRCPESKDEIIDESIQQANCLAGYIQSFTDGKSNLFFLRKLKNPEKSLVTIEIRDGRLTQAYRARNKPISYEERAVVHKWCEAMGFSYS